MSVWTASIRIRDTTGTIADVEIIVEDAGKFADEAEARFDLLASAAAKWRVHNEELSIVSITILSMQKETLQ